jgi:hypothetical protein
MADVNQTMQLTLSAKDEASEVLKRVHGELEKLWLRRPRRVAPEPRLRAR